MDEPFDLVVIGGGMAGLAAIHHGVRRGWRVLLLEAAGRLGGCVHTARVAPLEGFWLELGAHTLFNSYGEVAGLIAARGLASQVVPRHRLGYGLWQAGKVRRVPGQLHWLELLRAVPRWPGSHRAGQTTEAFFTRLVGRRNFAEVVGPALDAVSCQPAAALPADLLFRSKARRRDLPRSFTLPGGLSTLFDAGSGGAELRLESQVLGVAAEGKRLVCRLATGEVSASRVVLATPADVAVRLLAGLNEGLVEPLEGMGMNALESMGVVVRATDCRLRRLAGLIGRGAPFYSVVSRDGVPHPSLRGFTFHFRPGCCDEADKRHIAAEVLGTDTFAAEVHTVHRLPAPRLGHAERIAMLFSRLHRWPLALAGNYLSGLSLEECAASGAAAVRHLEAAVP